MLFAGKSDVGRKRTSNQDNFIVKRVCGNSVLLAVCDGMGGAAGGSIASGIATEVLSDCISEAVRLEAQDGIFKPDFKSVGFMFNSAIAKANSAVYNVAASTPALNGMGTTAVCAFVCENKLSVINVGDSRMYFISGGKIEQISKDHSYVQYLIDSGEMSQEQAKESTCKNIITRALGIDENVNADLYQRDVKAGDYILLCSDGLTNYVEENELFSIISDNSRDINAKLDMLIALANNRGGSDNITAVIAKI